MDRRRGASAAAPAWRNLTVILVRTLGSLSRSLTAILPPIQNCLPTGIRGRGGYFGRNGIHPSSPILEATQGEMDDLLSSSSSDIENDDDDDTPGPRSETLGDRRRGYVKNHAMIVPSPSARANSNAQYMLEDVRGRDVSGGAGAKRGEMTDEQLMREEQELAELDQAPPVGIGSVYGRIVGAEDDFGDFEQG